MVGKVIAGVAGFVVLIGSVSVVSYTLGWFGEGATVVQQEFGPRKSLIKYEWFVDQSNAIKARENDISLYEDRIKSLEDQYKDVQRKDWPRDDREGHNQQKAELAGIKASYNDLVREYNANSQKFNWNYANPNQIPQTYQVK